MQDGPCEQALILPGIAHCSYKHIWEEIMRRSPIAICIVGLDGRWMFPHPMIAEWLGYTEQELSKLTFQDVTHPDDLETDLELVQEVLDGRREWYQMEKRYIAKSGENVWVSLTVSAIAPGGKVLAFVSQIENINDRKEVEHQLREALMRETTLASTDTLTGLWNRRQFESELERNWGRLQRKGTPFAIIMIDVDDFKSINDLKGGHPAGDAVLKDIARKLESSVRLEDLVARPSGDEFMIIMPDTSDVKTAVDRIEKALCSAIEYEGCIIHYSCSVAGSVIGSEYKSLNEAYSVADDALYGRKRERKTLDQGQ